MKKIINRGFTLIELLVVIAIIGILASIVLVSLNSARSKGKDTRIISDVKEIQTQIEAEASAGGAYTAGGTNCVATPGSSANTAASALGGNCSTLSTDAGNNGGTMKVNTNAANASATSFTAYAVYSPLASNGTNSFCADSTGQVKTETTAAPATFSACW